MAIAFVGAADGGNATGTSHTFSYTCGAGSDRLLFVSVVGGIIGVDADDVTVTYNSTAMSKIGVVTTTINRFLSCFFLLNPSSGANNVVITAGASHFLSGAAADYSGVAQSGQPDASATNVAGPAASSITGTVTTIADNCWTIMGGYHNFDGNDFTAGTGTTRRTIDALLFHAIFDSNAAITPAGSTSLQGLTTSSNLGCVIASFSPAGAASFVPFPRPRGLDGGMYQLGGGISE